MKLKQFWMIPAISVAASTSAFSQAAVADVPAAAKVNKIADDFEAQKSDKLLDELVNLIDTLAKKNEQEIDAKRLLTSLGLDSISSYAFSSEKQGEEWLNLIYLHDNGANKGIFKLFGEQSVEYTVPTMCPKGTDLAFQMKLNLGNLEEIIREVMNASNASDEEIEGFEDSMNEDVPNLDMNISAMLKKINVNVNFALDMDEKEKLNTPFGAFDKPRFVARIDNIKWAWTALDKELQDPGSGMQRSENNGIITYTMAEEMEAMLMGYTPLLVMDTSKDQLWLATSPQFLTRCMSGENTLTNDIDYKATTKGLPKKGNSMVYMSKGFAKFAVELIEQHQELGNIPQEVEIEDILKELRGVKTGLLQTFTRDDEGFLIGSLSNQSMQDLIAELKKAMEKDLLSND